MTNKKSKYRVWDILNSKMYEPGERPDGMIGEYLELPCTEIPDENGKLIFTGDIIELDKKYAESFSVTRFRFAVEYSIDHGAFMIGRHDTTRLDTFLALVAPHCRVIGDVFRNPGMLLKDNSKPKLEGGDKNDLPTGLYE